jgi:hypothetical protein
LGNVIQNANLLVRNAGGQMPKRFRNLAQELTYNYIQELKTRHDKAYKVECESGADCYARILHRGEQLFFQQGGKAIICEISVTEGLLDMKSIKRWDDGSKITDAERESIKQCLSAFFQNTYGIELRAV